GGGWGGGQEFVCPLNLHLHPQGAMLEAFTYRLDAPSSGRLRWRPAAGGAPREGTPAVILVAGAEQLEQFTFADAIDPGLAVLVDPSRARILVGTPALLRSTSTQLMFLDGRYARHFRKFSDRNGYRGTRVVTWAVDWSPTAQRYAASKPPTDTPP